MNKDKRNELFEAIFQLADLEGRESAGAAKCIPMVVAQHENMVDDNSPVVKEWFVADGVCGFGWVSVRPGTSAFARWLVQTGKSRTSHYEGGVTVNSPLMTQSMTRNEAYAVGFAKVLQSKGIRAYAESRID